MHRIYIPISSAERTAQPRGFSPFNALSRFQFMQRISRELEAVYALRMRTHFSHNCIKSRFERSPPKISEGPRARAGVQEIRP